MRRIGVAVAAALLAYCHPAAGSATLYTRIDQGSCRKAPLDIARGYEARGLKVQECPAVPGYRLFLVSSEERSWLDVRGPDAAWSAERAVVHDPIGNFPNVGGANVVEWRRCLGNAGWTLTFRVKAQSADNPTRSVSALYVVALSSGDIALAGRTATNAQARKLAQRACHH